MHCTVSMGQKDGAPLSKLVELVGRIVFLWWCGDFTYDEPGAMCLSRVSFQENAILVHVFWERPRVGPPDMGIHHPALLYDNKLANN